MTFTKLEKIALCGALVAFGVNRIGASMHSPVTELTGGVLMAVAAAYGMVSNTIGYYRDLKKLERDYEQIKKE